MNIRQIRVGMDNFCYVLQCEQTSKAAIVDPGNNASRAMAHIGHENLETVCVINTHHHPDHSAESRRVADVYKCDNIASGPDAGNLEGVTKTVSDGETLMVGSIRLEILLTPGHTPGSMCILADGKVLLTGDTLFIGDCGRTDLPGGSDRQMFESLQRLKTLPDHILVYPGHDYGERPFDTLGNQKRTNNAMGADSPEALSKIP